MLLDTAPIQDPAYTRQEYGLRPKIEERHRQLKCFSDLESFTSRAFPLIANQVVFLLLTYSLLQWFLLRIGRKELNPKTRTRTLAHQLDHARPSFSLNANLTHRPSVANRARLPTAPPENGTPHNKPLAFFP